MNLSFLKVNSWKWVLVHLLIICTITFFFIYGFFNWYLPSYTRHKQTITVPNLENLGLDRAEEILSKRKLRFKVSEIAFSEKHALNTIIRQSPEAKSKVKENRTIYLTINEKEAPKVSITKDMLENKFFIDVNNFKNNLKSLKLEAGRATKVPGHKNFIYKVFANGKELKPGDKLELYTKIDYQVGNGNFNDEN